MNSTKLKEAWVPKMGGTGCVMDMAVKKYQVFVFCCIIINLFGGDGALFQFWVPRQLPGLPVPLLVDF